MIVVVGPLAYRPEAAGDPGAPAGLASAIARVAAAAGAHVEMAARVGDDPAGDGLLLALARAGVGHAATLRDPARRTMVVETPSSDGTPLVPLATGPGGAAVAAPMALEPPAWPGDDPSAALDAGDIDLALGYLLDAHVVVVAQTLDEPAAATVARHATFADAALVVIVEHDSLVAPALDRAIVFERDEGDGDAFAALVGRFAASLDAGSEAGEAFDEARATLGWRPAEA